MRALDFIAGPHTARAGNAGGVIEGEEWIRVVAHSGAFHVRPIGIPNSIDAACERQFAQWPQALPAFRLFRHIQFDDIVAMPPKPIALGADDHIGSDRSRTGGRSPRLPFNFTDTETARAKGGKLMRDAEAGYRNPGLLRRLVNRIAWFRCHSLAIDIELHRFLSTVFQAESRQVFKS